MFSGVSFGLMKKFSLRVVYEAACILLSPGVGSMGCDANGAGIVSGIHKLNNWVNYADVTGTGADRAGFDSVKDALLCCRWFGNVSSHLRSPIITAADVPEVMMLLDTVALGVMDHLFDNRAKLGLDDELFRD